MINKEEILFFSPPNIPLNPNTYSGIETVFKRIGDNYSVVQPSTSKYLTKYNPIIYPFTENPDDPTCNKWFTRLEDIQFRNIRNYIKNPDKVKAVFLPYLYPYFFNIFEDIFPNAKFYIWYHEYTSYQCDIFGTRLQQKYLQDKPERYEALAISDFDQAKFNNFFRKNLIKRNLHPYFLPESITSITECTNNRRICVVSRLNQDRHFYEILYSFRLIPEVKIDIYGYFLYIDVAFKKKCMELIDKLPNVEFKGYLHPEDIGKTVSQYALFINCLNDSFGMGAYEAAYLGLTIACPHIKNSPKGGEFCYSDPNHNLISAEVEKTQSLQSMYDAVIYKIKSLGIDSIDKKANMEFVRAHYSHRNFEIELQDIING